MIIVRKEHRVLIQGITGKQGTFWTELMQDYGTNIVGGVTPGKGGQDFEEIPIFNTVAEAVAETDANATVIFVPPPFAGDAIMEAAEGVGMTQRQSLTMVRWQQCTRPKLQSFSMSMSRTRLS